MTVENTISKSGKQVMGSRTYDFTFDDLLKDPTEEAAKAAIKCSISNGEIETQLVYGRDYSVTLNNNRKGGRVTVADPKDASWRIIIYRSYEPTQGADYNDFDALPAETMEQCFDKLTMLIQQQQEQLDRTIKVDITGNISPDEYMDAFLNDLDDIKNLASGQAESAAQSALNAQNSAQEAHRYATSVKFGMRRVAISKNDWQLIENNKYRLFLPDEGLVTAVYKEVAPGIYDKTANVDIETTSAGTKLTGIEDFNGYALIGQDSGKQIVFDQSTPSDEWVIIHNLNCYPQVTCIDENGVVVIGTVQYISLYEVHITFTEEYAGKAVLN